MFIGNVFNNMPNNKELKEIDLEKVSGGTSEDKPVIMSGKVVSYYGYLKFVVELNNGSRVSCEVDKKIKSKAISLINGDTVKVKLDKEDQTEGIIVDI